MLDPGPFGCIGIGVPYGIAASLAFPDRPVVVATGDGAFGFNAIEVDTAVRHKAPVLIVVANNGAWQIEVHDQTVTHGKVVGTKLQFADHAAMARAFGMHAERVETAEQLGRARQPAGAARHGRDTGGGVVGRQDRTRLGAGPAAARRLGRGGAEVAWYVMSGQQHSWRGVRLSASFETPAFGALLRVRGSSGRGIPPHGAERRAPMQTKAKRPKAAPLEPGGPDLQAWSCIAEPG